MRKFTLLFGEYLELVIIMFTDVGDVITFEAKKTNTERSNFTKRFECVQLYNSMGTKQPTKFSYFAKEQRKPIIDNER